MTDQSAITPDPAPQPFDNDHNDRRHSSWDIRNAPRNYVSIVATQLISALFSFASVWLLTRYLGTDGYGGIVAILAGSQIAQMFVNWTCLGLARFGVEEYVESGLINRTFWTRTIILLPNLLIFLCCAYFWMPLLTVWLKLPADAGNYLVIHFAAMAAWLHIQHALQATKLPRSLGILIAAERVLIFALIAVLIYSGKLSYSYGILAYSAGPAAMALIGLVIIRKFISWPPVLSADWTKKLLKFSVPLIPFSLFGYLSTNYLDAIFISQYLTRSDLGIYSVAYQISGMMMQFIVLAGSLLMPLFVTLRSQGRDETVRTYLYKVLPVVSLGWGVFCFLGAATLSFLIVRVFGPEFIFANGILTILMISVAVNAPVLIGYAPYINAVSASYISTAIIIVLGIVNTAANYLLIPSFGLAGAAWATTLAYTASVLTAALFLWWKFRVGNDLSLVGVIPGMAGLASFWFTGSLFIGFSTTLLLALLFILWQRREIRDLVVNLRRMRSASRGQTS